MLITKNWEINLKTKEPYMWWRVIAMLVIGGLTAIIFGGIIITYNYVYETLDDARVIVALNSSNNLNQINLSAFDKAQKAIALKNETTEIPNNIRNIFAYAEASTSTATSTIIK